MDLVMYEIARSSEGSRCSSKVFINSLPRHRRCVDLLQSTSSYGARRRRWSRRWCIDVVEKGGDDLFNGGHSLELDLLGVAETTAVPHAGGQSGGLVVKVLSGDGVVVLIIGGGLDGAGNRS